MPGGVPSCCLAGSRLAGSLWDQGVRGGGAAALKETDGYGLPFLRVTMGVLDEGMSGVGLFDQEMAPGRFP